MKRSFPSLTLVFLLVFFAEKMAAQSLRGRLTEADGGSGLPAATLFLFQKDSLPVAQTTTDSSGRFQFEKQKAGLFRLKINALGFEKREIPEIELAVGKEAVVEITLFETSHELQAVEIRPDGNFERVAVGQTILTKEATLRFPATFFDPARLAQNMAGVASSDDGINGLAVHGLPPSFMSWRIEGMEVVNPNHLSNAGTQSDRPTTNSGGVNMLSAQMLDNSSLLTGPLPASMGNAMGGLIDFRLRAGNNQRLEGTAQASLVGLDGSLEGPISRKKRASFLINYRYSTVGLLEKLGVSFGDEAINFQDLAAKLNFPFQKNRGEFSVFGIAGQSENIFNRRTDSTLVEFEKDFHDIFFQSKTKILGAVLKNNWRKGWQTRTAFLWSGSVTRRTETTYFDQQSSQFIEVDSTRFRRQSAQFSVSKKWSRRLQLSSGFEFGNIKVNDGLIYTDANGNPINSLLDDHKKRTTSFWLNYEGVWYEKFQLQLGLRATNYAMSPTLNGDFFSDKFRKIWLAEPRAALTFRATEKQALTLAFALNSQYLPAQLGQDKAGKLDLPKGNLLSLQHRVQFSNTASLTTTAFHQYFQKLKRFGTAGGLSILNSENGDLSGGSNDGIAESGGLETTFQKFLTHGFFMNLNATVCELRYEGADSTWRPSRFDNQWQTNLIVGKEWNREKRTGKSRIFGLNAGLHARGGFWESPINEAASAAAGTTVRNESKANSVRLPAYFRLDLRVYLKKNVKNHTSTLALDLQNATNQQNVGYHFYDAFQKKVLTKYQLGLIPNLSWRLDFGRNRS